MHTELNNSETATLGWKNGHSRRHAWLICDGRASSILDLGNSTSLSNKNWPGGLEISIANRVPHGLWTTPVCARGTRISDIVETTKSSKRDCKDQQQAGRRQLADLHISVDIFCLLVQICFSSIGNPFSFYHANMLFPSSITIFQIKSSIGSGRSP